MSIESMINLPIYTTVLAVGMSREILDPGEDPVISPCPSIRRLPLPPVLQTFKDTSKQKTNTSATEKYVTTHHNMILHIVALVHFVSD